MNTGVYCIKNKINGKLYIGSTTQGFNIRKGRHIRSLNQGNHHSAILQKAWNKYGEQAFQFIILEKVMPEHCITREQWYLNWYPNEYNISKIAGSCLGVKMSDETKKKLSAIHLGMKHTIDTKIKIGLAGKGRKYSQQAKTKISIARMGVGNGMFQKFGKLNPASRPVLCYDSILKSIREFDCIKDCARHLNLKFSTLAMILRGNNSQKSLQKKGISVAYKMEGKDIAADDR